MGALTAKPIAFTGRPWEFDETFAIDLYDCFGTNIIINTRGTDIIRIIPRINKNLNKFLITDRIRFHFDALKVQRILKPMLVLTQPTSYKMQLIVCTLRDLLPIFYNIIIASQKLFVILGNFINTNHVSFIYSVINNFLTTQYYVFNQEHSGTYKKAAWSNLLYPAQVINLNKYRTTIVLTSNIRIEMPLLYYKIQQWVQNSYDNLLLTYGTNNNNLGKYIGNDPRIIARILQGNSRLFNYINSPLLIVIGPSKYEQINSLLSLITQLQKNGILFNIIGTWFNPTMLALQLFDYITAPFILRFYNYLSEFKYNTSVLLVNTNHIRTRNIKYLLYFGHHAPNDIKNFDVIFPIRHYFETNGYFINFQGILQKSNKAIDNSEFLYSFYDIFYLLTITRFKHMRFARTALLLK